MGRLPRDGTYRVSRAGEILFEGGLASLKHQKVFKDIKKHALSLDTFTYYQEEVSEINQNQECGLRVEDKDVQFQAGDIVTCFSTRWVFN